MQKQNKKGKESSHKKEVKMSPLGQLGMALRKLNFNENESQSRCSEGAIIQKQSNKVTKVEGRHRESMRCESENFS